MNVLRQPRQRSRIGYLAATLATIAAGLASRHRATGMPDLLGQYPGDVLWALMVFFGWGLLLRRSSSLQLAAWALAFAFAIEFLKLCPWPWLVALRHDPLGRLVFGQVFAWPNLVAYAIGVGVGVALEAALLRRPGSRVVTDAR